jgi:hypothetical protein
MEAAVAYARDSTKFPCASDANGPRVSEHSVRHLSERPCGDQISYYENEADEHSYTDHRLEVVVQRCLSFALAATLVYLVVHFLHEGRVPSPDSGLCDDGVLIASFERSRGDAPRRGYRHFIAEHRDGLGAGYPPGLPHWRRLWTG